jgi:hypothetical protein
MALQDDAKPGIYEDRDGNIWEKRNSGLWFVNGVLWNPFPDDLMSMDDFRLQKRLDRENQEAIALTSKDLEIGYVDLPNMKWGVVSNAEAQEKA